MSSRLVLVIHHLTPLLLTILLFLLPFANFSFAKLIGQANSTEEAYFLLEEASSRKDSFVVRVTDVAQINKARSALAGANFSEKL